MQLSLYRPPLDQGQVKRPGIPRLNRAHPLAQGMRVAMLDVGGRIYDFARSYAVQYAPESFSPHQAAGLYTRGQSPFGAGINWQGASWNALNYGVFLRTGYLNQTDPESQITLDTTLSNQGAGAGFTIATAFFQTPGYTSTSGSMVFGRPGNAWEGQPFLNCAITVSPTSGITGPSPTVGFVYNNNGGINQCGATGGWNNWETKAPYSESKFVSAVATAYNTSSGSATTKQYHNGSLVASSTGVVLQTTNTSAGADQEAQLFIGSVYHINAPAAFEIFQGFIYYGYIWNRALTPEEARELHNHPYCMFVWPEDEIFATLIGVAGGVVDIALSAAAGSYALTGQAATLKVARRVNAAAGSYALSGQVVALRHSWKAPASASSYALTGQPAALRQARKLPAAVGSYALTGQPVGLKRGLKVAAAAASYSLNGQAASQRHGWMLAASAGAYGLTGSDATLTKLTTKVVSASAGSFSLSGMASGVLHGSRVSAGAGSYALTGTSANLLKGRKVASVAGSYAFAGSVASLLRARKLPAGLGNYLLSGSNATLINGSAIFIVSSRLAAPPSESRRAAPEGVSRRVVVSSEDRGRSS